MNMERGEEKKSELERDNKCRSLKVNKFFKKVIDLNSRKSECSRWESECGRKR